MSDLRVEDNPSCYEIYTKLKRRAMQLLSLTVPTESSSQELEVVLVHILEFR